MKKRWMTWLGLCLCTALLAGCSKDTGEEQSAKKATESKTKQSVEETTEELTEEATEEETEVKPTIFQIAEQDIELTPGGEAQLSVKVLPENVDISGVKWTSKNEEVVSVDSTGKVTAVKEGKAGITASLGKMNATCMITVKNAQAETQPATVQAAAAGYDLNQELAGVEAQCQTVMDELNSGKMTQMDMNRAAGRCYTIWDDELNALWDRLTPLLTEEEHTNYLAEQRAWIQEKEAAIEEAGLMWEGGSARPLAEYTAGEEWTRKRCYVLAGYLGSKIGQTVDMSPLNNESSY